MYIPSVIIACLLSNHNVLKCCANQNLPHFPLPLSFDKSQTSNFIEIAIPFSFIEIANLFNTINKTTYCLLPQCLRIDYVLIQKIPNQLSSILILLVENNPHRLRFSFHFIEFIIASCCVFYLIRQQIWANTNRKLCTQAHTLCFINPLTNTAI